MDRNSLSVEVKVRREAWKKVKDEYPNDFNRYLDLMNQNEEEGVLPEDLTSELASLNDLLKARVQEEEVIIAEDEGLTWDEARGGWVYWVYDEDEDPE